MEAPQEVRRSDNELCGFVSLIDEGYQPLTVFLVPFGSSGSWEETVELVTESGLEVIRDRWLAEINGEWVQVLIQEASTTSVRVTTDIFGGGGRYGESHTFEAGTPHLKHLLA